MPRVGSPWTRELHAVRDDVLHKRALWAAERSSRPSVQQWYAGRTVLVTGGSGFLGRVLIELLLRCCPDIGRVYVVLRAKRGVAAAERLHRLLAVPLFDRLRAEQPHALDKVEAVPGDVEALWLGLDEDTRGRLCAEVSVVFHVAASVRFDDPFRKAVFTNLRSTREVVKLARDMPQLKVLVHVSTAYCFINQNPVGECVYPSKLDWREVIRWAEELSDDDQQVVDFLGDKLRGFQPNTYTLTKALAEELAEEASKDLPITITRPSIVVGSVHDPMPGWMDNLNGLCGFWAGAFKGLLCTARGPNVTFDTVPVDIAAKLILLASWTRGLGLKLSPEAQGQEQTADVVNVTVGNGLGISYEEFRWATSEDGVRNLVPYPGVLRVPSFRHQTCPFTSALLSFYHHIFFGIVLDLLARVSGVKPRVVDIYRKLTVALAAVAPFRQEFTFEMANQRKLQSLIHPADEGLLDFLKFYSMRDNIEAYRETVADVVRGILVYVLNEEDNVEKNLKNLNRVKWIMRGYHTLIALLFCALVVGFYRLL